MGLGLGLGVGVGLGLGVVDLIEDDVVRAAREELCHVECLPDPPQPRSAIWAQVIRTVMLLEDLDDALTHVGVARMAVDSLDGRLELGSRGAQPREASLGHEAAQVCVWSYMVNGGELILGELGHLPPIAGPLVRVLVGRLLVDEEATADERVKHMHVHIYILTYLVDEEATADERVKHRVRTLEARP